MNDGAIGRRIRDDNDANRWAELIKYRFDINATANANKRSDRPVRSALATVRMILFFFTVTDFA